MNEATSNKFYVNVPHLHSTYLPNCNDAGVFRIFQLQNQANHMDQLTIQCPIWTVTLFRITRRTTLMWVLPRVSVFPTLASDTSTAQLEQRISGVTALGTNNLHYVLNTKKKISASSIKSADGEPKLGKARQGRKIDNGHSENHSSNNSLHDI